MTEHDLKEMKNLGAELGAAKAELEKLRGLLRELREITSEYAWDVDLEAKVDAALSQQAEPTDTYTAVEMATAAAQGFRDGQEAVEQAPAQDEREPWTYCPECGSDEVRHQEGEHKQCARCHQEWFSDIDYTDVVRGHLATRPAQTEQQPFAYADPSDLNRMEKYGQACMTVWRDKQDCVSEPLFLRAAPIAQTAPQGKFRMGDLVKKSTGSEWEGRVVGWYRTEQTAEGYAVESSAHRNSVQIYPAKALEAVE